MNTAHIHLLINHFPIVGLVFSLLVMAIGLLRGNKEWVRASLFIAIVSGVFAVFSNITGEGAEDVLRKFPGFDKDLVEEHEDAATFAVISMSLLAVTAAVSLFFSIKKKQIPRVLVVAVVFLQLFAMSVVARTNFLGGHITHVEIR